MRYTERIKYIWDILTLHNWHWLVMGLFIVAILLDSHYLALVLGIVAVGLLAVAYVREGSSRGRKE